jgi:hypothetical protein
MFQATSAHRLLWPSELLPLDQPPRLSARRSLLSLGRRRADGKPPSLCHDRRLYPLCSASRASESADNGQPRLQSLGPIERPTLQTPLFAKDGAAALLTFSPFEVFGMTGEPRLSPRVLGLHQDICRNSAPACADLHLRVSIRSCLAPTPKSRCPLPGVSHLVRIPPSFTLSRYRERASDFGACWTNRDTPAPKHPLASLRLFG